MVPLNDHAEFPGPLPSQGTGITSGCRGVRGVFRVLVSYPDLTDQRRIEFSKEEPLFRPVFGPFSLARKLLG